MPKVIVRWMDRGVSPRKVEDIQIPKIEEERERSRHPSVVEKEGLPEMFDHKAVNANTYVELHIDVFLYSLSH